jgi:hypothetical protein
VWAYSFGKIDHDILLVLLPAFLAGAGWDGRKTPRAWPLALFALVISLAMAAGAWQKASSGWLSPSTNAVLGHSIWFAVQDAPSASWNFAIRFLPRPGWKLMDYVTVAFEAAFLVAVARAAAFRGVCAFACFFHVAVAMLMRITFVSNIPAYAVFVDWEDLAARMSARPAIERLERTFETIGTLPLVAVSAALCAIYLRWGSPIRILTTLLGPDLEILPRAIAIGATAILAAGFALMRLRARRAERGEGRGRFAR